jgi:isochorismatase family protein
VGEWGCCFHVEELVTAGMMSSMCVDPTVRAAADLGFSVTVVHDGCAAPDLRFGDVDVPGASVHAAFMAALSDGYATVVSADELLSPSRASARRPGGRRAVSGMSYEPAR